MCANVRVSLTRFFLLILAMRGDFALAEAPPQTPLLPSAITNTCNSSEGVPAKLAPVGSPLDSAGEIASPGTIQIPGVLREIGQRQTELTILELDLKRAELQKKLRELEAVFPNNGVPYFPTAAAQNSNVPVSPITKGWEGPQVRRIHKVGNELVAVVVIPGGETKNVRSGGFVGKELRVVEILPETVYVRQGDRQIYALPVFQTGRWGS
jgi:type IV pilus biogenesis protein PilP